MGPTRDNSRQPTGADAKQIAATAPSGLEALAAGCGNAAMSRVLGVAPPGSLARDKPRPTSADVTPRWPPRRRRAEEAPSDPAASHAEAQYGSAQARIAADVFRSGNIAGAAVFLANARASVVRICGRRYAAPRPPRMSAAADPAADAQYGAAQATMAAELFARDPAGADVFLNNAQGVVQSRAREARR